MNQLGKVLKGLKCCMGKNDESPIPFTNGRRCSDCPYCEVTPPERIGILPAYICYHNNLMQDTIDIIENYTKWAMRADQQEKKHQAEIDSWSACSYG